MPQVLVRVSVREFRREVLAAQCVLGYPPCGIRVNRLTSSDIVTGGMLLLNLFFW
jgi:hypothetical protein